MNSCVFRNLIILQSNIISSFCSCFSFCWKWPMRRYRRQPMRRWRLLCRPRQLRRPRPMRGWIPMRRRRLICRPRQLRPQRQLRRWRLLQHPRVWQNEDPQRPASSGRSWSEWGGRNLDGDSSQPRKIFWKWVQINFFKKLNILGVKKFLIHWCTLVRNTS